ERKRFRLSSVPNNLPYVKDAFHEYLLHGRADAVNPKATGTKAAAHYRLEIPAGGEVTVRLRLTAEAHVVEPALGLDFDRIFADRLAAADAFYQAHIPDTLTPEEQRVARQAYAGLLWSKQFYHYVIHDWLEGDPNEPPPPASRKHGRNWDWPHLFNRDVISMPDKWEYPWF